MQNQVVQTNQIQSGMNTGHIGTTQHMMPQHTIQSASSQVMFWLQRATECSVIEMCIIAETKVKLHLEQYYILKYGKLQILK